MMTIGRANTVDGAQTDGDEPNSDVARAESAEHKLGAQLMSMKQELLKQQLVNATLSADLKRSNQDLKLLQARGQQAIQAAVDSVSDSLSYRVGRNLITHTRQPWKLPLLPFKLWRTFHSSTAEHRRSSAATTTEITNWFLKPMLTDVSVAPVFGTDEIDTVDSRSDLRAAFWPAFRAGDVRVCYLILQRLKRLQAENFLPREEHFIEKLASKMPRELRLFEQIPDKQPLSANSKAPSIAYLLHNSLPFASGGYATRAHGLATALQERGQRVTVLTRPGFPLDNKLDLHASDIEISTKIDEVEYRRILSPSRAKLKNVDYMSAAADAIEAQLQEIQPTLVMAASNHYTALPALIASRRLGIPFAYEVRGFWEITRVSREPAFKLTPAYALQEFMEAEVCRQADVVFTLTGAMRNELVRRGVGIDKIHLLPNACHPHKFLPTPKSASLADRLNIPVGVPIIGYIGSFVQYEGLEDLASACGKLKAMGVEFRLLVVGNENVSGSELGPIATAIKDNAKAGDFEDWLIMPGRIPHEDVPDYYSLVDIAAFPRKPQPVTEMVSPMKPLEAMAMEKAVLVSSVEAMAEMISHGETGMVFQKGDLDDFADKLMLLITNPDKRAEMGKNARQWVVANRTWSATASKAIDAIEQMQTT